MEMLYLPVLMLAILASRPFLWGSGSARARTALTRLTADGPSATGEERAELLRSLVFRDRLVVVAVVAAVAAIEILIASRGGVPPEMVVMTVSATHLLLALVIAQIVVAIVVSLHAGVRSAALTARPVHVAVARMRRPGVTEYASRLALVTPAVFLALTLLANTIVLIAVLRGAIPEGLAVLSFTALAIGAVVYLVAIALSVTLAQRSVRAVSSFGIFSADLSRAEAVRALLGLAGTSAAAALYISLYPLSAFFFAGGGGYEDTGASLFAFLAVLVFVVVFIVMFRNAFRVDGTREMTQRLWVGRREHQDA